MKYFAYGSLLGRDRMSELCTGAEPPAPLFAARIPHHRLRFTGQSATWRGGTATISLAAGCELWGAVYEVDAECRAAIEAHGLEEGYVWSWTTVEDVEGARRKVGVLVKVRGLEPAEPSEAYLRTIREGRRDWDLDAEDLDDVTSASEGG